MRQARVHRSLRLKKVIWPKWRKKNWKLFHFCSSLLSWKIVTDGGWECYLKYSTYLDIGLYKIILRKSKLLNEKIIYLSSKDTLSNQEGVSSRENLQHSCRRRCYEQKTPFRYELKRVSNRGLHVNISKREGTSWSSCPLELEGSWNFGWEDIHRCRHCISVFEPVYCLHDRAHR